MTVTAGNRVLVGFVGNAGHYSTLSISDSQSNSYTLLVAYAGTAIGNTQSIFISNGPVSAGGLTVTATLGGADIPSLIAMEISGVASGTSMDVAAVTHSASSFGTSQTGGTITPATAGDLLVNYADTQVTNATFTAGSGWTTLAGSIATGSGGSPSFFEWIAGGTTSATTATWTVSSSDEPDSILIALKAAATTSADAGPRRRFFAPGRGPLQFAKAPPRQGDTTIQVPQLNLALTGTALTFTQGSVVYDPHPPLTGTALALSQGTLAYNVAYTLTGTALALSQGTLAYNLAPTLTGTALALSQGTLAYNLALALTGTALTFSQGTITYAGGGSVNVTLTGTGLTCTQGSIVPEIDLALTGTALALSQGALAYNAAWALGGTALALSQGALGYALAVSLTGTALTFSQGTVNFAEGLVLPLTGTALAFSQGSITIEADLPLTGQPFAFSQGTVGVPGAVSTMDTHDGFRRKKKHVVVTSQNTEYDDAGNFQPFPKKGQQKKPVSRVPRDVDPLGDELRALFQERAEKPAATAPVVEVKPQDADDDDDEALILLLG
jgi:hypothetical protein